LFSYKKAVVGVAQKRGDGCFMTKNSSKQISYKAMASCRRLGEFFGEAKEEKE